MAADLRPLGLARAAIGALILLRTTPLGAALHVVGGPRPDALLGWPDGRFHFAVAGLALPDGVVAALCVARTVAALALLGGVWSRAAGLVAGIAGYLVLAQDAFAWLQTLHLLFLAAILLGLTDAGARFALVPGRPRAPASSLALMRVFVASIYLWAGVAKLRADWLDGRALAAFAELRAIGGPLGAIALASPARRAAVAIAVAALELVLGPALLWRRTRRIALVAALALHAAIELVARADVFGWAMAALLLVFVGGDQRQAAPAAGQTISECEHISSETRGPAKT